jgi:hypothetical protein
MKRLLPFVLACLVLPQFADAFPPAPYFTLFGSVRDQVGLAILAENAEVVLLRNDKEVSRTPIVNNLWIDYNYEFKIRLDANRPGTQAYRNDSIPVDGQFSIVVAIDGIHYFPIEVSGTLSAGTGSERMRLDLTLGEDTDLDGLPDVWEQWQLYIAGVGADETGEWPIHLIDRGSDFDGDGQSNYHEYLAGTYAGDPMDSLTLEIREKLMNHVRFEFYAITGKTYTIERSPDMINWSRVKFSMDTPSDGSYGFHAESVGVRSAFSESSNDAGDEYYRLVVR